MDVDGKELQTYLQWVSQVHSPKERLSKHNSCLHARILQGPPRRKFVQVNPKAMETSTAEQPKQIHNWWPKSEEH